VFVNSAGRIEGREMRTQRLIPGQIIVEHRAA
jgi:hypothetical protein